VSEATDTLAEAMSVLTDAESGHGVLLYLEDAGGPVVAAVAPIPLEKFEGRIAENVAAMVLVSVMRDEFEGPVPTSATFTDQASGFTYRSVSSENLPSRPHVEFVCEAYKSIG